MHPSLITLHSARDDPSGGRRSAQIPQLDTPQASKESHNSIHNLRPPPQPAIAYRYRTELTDYGGTYP